MITTAMNSKYLEISRAEIDIGNGDRDPNGIVIDLRLFPIMIAMVILEQCIQPTLRGVLSSSLR